MLFRNLSRMAEIRRIDDDAGTVDDIDMQGFDSIIFLVNWESDNDANLITSVSQRADTDDSWEVIKGSELKVGDDGNAEYGWIELHKPKRYLRIITAEEGDECNAVFAIKFRARRQYEDVDNVVDAEVFGKLISNPEEGAADA